MVAQSRPRSRGSDASRHGPVSGPCRAGYDPDLVIAAPRLPESLYSQTGDNYGYDPSCESVACHPHNFRRHRPAGQRGWIRGMQRVEPQLYELEHVHGAAPWLNQKPVIVVEAKACVDRLWNTVGGSMPATSSVGGLGQWETGHAEQLTRVGVKDVAVIPDGCGSSSLAAQSVSSAAARQEAIGSVKAW